MDKHTVPEVIAELNAFEKQLMDCIDRLHQIKWDLIDTLDSHDPDVVWSRP